LLRFSCASDLVMVPARSISILRLDHPSAALDAPSSRAYRTTRWRPGGFTRGFADAAGAAACCASVPFGGRDSSFVARLAFFRCKRLDDKTISLSFSSPPSSSSTAATLRLAGSLPAVTSPAVVTIVGTSWSASSTTSAPDTARPSAVATKSTSAPDPSTSPSTGLPRCSYPPPFQQCSAPPCCAPVLRRIRLVWFGADSQAICQSTSPNRRRPIHLHSSLNR
jgi:hypothetical protein